MADHTVIELSAPADSDPLTDLIRDGARRLIGEAVHAEVEELLKIYATERMADGRRRVVRNGYQPAREILTGISGVEVKIPKVRSRVGEAVTFHSTLVPPYIRRSGNFRVLLTDDAARDLEEIWDYISRHDASARADYVLDQIEGAFQSLSEQGHADCPMQSVHVVDPDRLPVRGGLAYETVAQKHVLQSALHIVVMIDFAHLSLCHETRNETHVTRSRRSQR